MNKGIVAARKQWDWDSYDYQVGNYWPLVNAEGRHIGYAIVCPYEIIPNETHRHHVWFMPGDFWDYEDDYTIINTTAIRCPETGHFYRIVDGLLYGIDES